MFGETQGRRRATARRNLTPPLSSVNGIDGLPIASSISARGAHNPAALPASDAKKAKMLENVVVCLLLIALTASLLLLTNLPGRRSPELIQVSTDDTVKTQPAGSMQAVRRADALKAADGVGDRGRERNLQQKAKVNSDLRDAPYHRQKEEPGPVVQGGGDDGTRGAPINGRGFEPRLFVDYEHIEVVSAFNPRAYLWRGFLSPEETTYLRDIAKAEGMKDSKVVNSTSGERMSSTVRTSTGATLSHNKYGNDSVISNIEKRMDIWSNLPHENGESLQILRYEFSQEVRCPYHKQTNKESNIQ